MSSIYKVYVCRSINMALNCFFFLNSSRKKSTSAREYCLSFRCTMNSIRITLSFARRWYCKMGKFKAEKTKKKWSSRFTLYLIIAFFISITFEAAARVCGWMTAMCTYVNDTHSYEALSTSRFFMSCLYFCAFFFGRHRIRIAVNKMVKTIILSKKCEQSSGLVYTA